MRDDLLDIRGIAKLLGVKHRTVQLWSGRTRAILPAPAARISGNPVWRRGDIIRWATETGRWDPVAGQPRIRRNRYDWQHVDPSTDERKAIAV
jgi:hypothetical protein